MNPETPKFEAKTIKTFSIPDGAKMLVFEQTFFNEEPSVIAKDSVPGVEIPVVPSISSPEVSKKAPEYTESQLFWQKMFENGDQVLYNREKGSIKTDALKAALSEAKRDLPEFMKNFGKHVHDIDTDFRGGRDAGDVKERLQRTGTLLGVLGLFTAFDWGTSKAIEQPFNRIFPTEGKTKDKDKQYFAMRGALRKVLEVMNDKYASVLGNMLVENLSGKRGFIHEVADKGADTITVGIDGWDDWVNGSTLESAQRILFQVPIAGAILEQGLTRLSMFQEKSPLHTVTGKMLYMGLGVLLRELEVGKKPSAS